MYHDWSTANNIILYHYNYHFNRKPCNHFFKISMHIRIILECFEKCKCPGIYFFLQSSKCVSNEQHCLKTAGLYDDLLRSLFHFFIFHIQCSHLFYVFQFLQHLFFWLFFLKVLSNVVEKFCIYTHIHIEYVYIHTYTHTCRVCII